MMMIPEARKEHLERLRKIIRREKLIETNPSEAGINPLTQLDKHPPIFFGIGGGSQELSQGLSTDILAMLLVAQKLKKDFCLGPGYIFLADETTATNGFSRRSVERLMTGEKKLLEIILNGLGMNDWVVFLESGLEEILGSEARKRYELMINDADRVFINGHCYEAREAAATWLLAGQNKGGIKIGWASNGSKNDERYFDKNTIDYLRLRNIPNLVSFVYTLSGIRLFPGKTGMLERVPNYVCIKPWNSILLRPFEEPVKKFKEATLAGGGLQWKQSKRLFSGITSLFEELMHKEIPTSEKQEFQGQRIAENIAFIIQYIFNGREKEAETIWNETFQTAL